MCMSTTEVLGATLKQFWELEELPIVTHLSPAEKVAEEFYVAYITYGTSAAPFQALRTLRQLAILDGSSLPIAANALLNDTFVDVILTGANTEDEALTCQDQLIQLCSLAQFELRMWASNNNSILQAVSEENRAMLPAVLLEDDEQPGLKILGLQWNPVANTFSFSAKPSLNAPTKRSVLSDIARIFDPFGLLSPITFWMKYLMQRLWTSGVTWDDPLPVNLGGSWAKFHSELPLIEQILIPRRITCDNTISIQLHAFSDSSEKGYAAAIYIRIQTATSIHCQLVAGKSKVAPLKRSTIP